CGAVVRLAGGQGGPSSIQMARIAVALAFEQVVAGRLVRGQRRAPLQEGVELRRERADVVRAFVEGDGLPPVVIDPVRPGAVFRTQANRGGIRAEPRRPSRGAADLLGVSREVDVERALPQMSSKSFRYWDWASLKAMQAVSGLPCSRGSTGGCWACSASALCSKYPVERPSQKFPPKNSCCVSLNWRTGNLGEYVYRCAVRLPARKRNDPGYATIVRFTDGIGPLNA